MKRRTPMPKTPKVVRLAGYSVRILIERADRSFWQPSERQLDEIHRIPEVSETEHYADLIVTADFDDADHMGRRLEAVRAATLGICNKFADAPMGAE